MSVDLIRYLLAQLSVFSFIAAGFSLILLGGSPVGRNWAGRFLLIGAVLAVVSGLVTTEWMP